MNVRFTPAPSSSAPDPSAAGFAALLAKTIRRLALGGLAAALLTTSVSAAFWTTTGAQVTHDPSIIKDGSTWWIFETGDGIPVKWSADGRAWNQGVRLLNTPKAWWNDWAPARDTALRVWAPDIQRFNNRTWCYYSVSEFGKNNSAIGLMSCSSIAAGDWRDDGFVLGSRSGQQSYNAIDPNLVIDASGNPWLAFGSWFSGIQIVRLDRNTMKPTGSITRLAARSGGIEGPTIVYTGGYYYLFVSIDRCCDGVNSTYKVAYGRSTSITGPYRDKNNVLMTSGGATVLDAGNTRWKGPGGQDVYQNGSAWVLARHAYDATDNGTPKLLINDLYWSGGWPTY